MQNMIPWVGQRGIWRGISGGEVAFETGTERRESGGEVSSWLVL